MFLRLDKLGLDGEAYVIIGAYASNGMKPLLPSEGGNMAESSLALRLLNIST